MSSEVVSKGSLKDEEEQSLHWEHLAKRLSMIEPQSRYLPENENDQFLIYPDDSFLDYWNSLMILLLLYTATVIPYRLILTEPDEEGYIIWDTIADCLFFIDILINCLLSYYDSDGNLVKNKKLIIKNYLMTWFIIDISSCIPLQLIFQTDKNYSKVLRIGRLPRLYRLIKMAKLIRMIKMIKSRSQVLKYIGEILKVNAGVERFIWFLITFMLLIHVLSCLWIFIGVFYMDDNFNNWITQTGNADLSNGELYVTGLYWCVTTLATVGYGDIRPYNTAERLFTTIVMVIGIFIYSYIIGSLTNLISNADSRKAKLTKKLEILDNLTQEYGFNQNFYKKLSAALESQHLNDNEEINDLFEDIPSHLKTQLLILIHQNMLQGNHFFAGKPPFFVAFVGPLLRPMRFEQNEYVYRETDYAKEMYFIVKGELDMVFNIPETDDEIAFNQLPVNYYFGETDILFSEGKLRNFGVKTTEKCQLLLLDHLDFESLLKKFEEESLEIMTMAHDRNRRLLEKKNMAIEAYMGQLEYKKLTSMPSSTRIPRLIKLSDLLGLSHSNSLISEKSKNESNFKLFTTSIAENPDIHELITIKPENNLTNEKINGETMFKVVIEDKLIKEEDNLKVAKKKISKIENDVQECLRVLKNITDFFSDISDEPLNSHLTSTLHT